MPWWTYVYSMRARARVCWLYVQKPCVSAAFEPSGRMVAIGTTVGRFIVLESVTGSHVVSVQLGTESLDVLGFSPGLWPTKYRWRGDRRGRGSNPFAALATPLLV